MGRLPVGRKAVERAAQSFMTAYPDLVVKFDRLEPKGDRIVTPDLNRDVCMPDLATHEGQAAVDALEDSDVKLMILDNLSCLTSGPENEAESWQPLQSWGLRHRAHGRSVVLIHHSGKGGGQRGTSRREDVLDTVLALRRPSDYAPAQGARRSVRSQLSTVCP
jgi:hypothetical protein